MEYKQEPQKDDGVRYVLEDGKFKKMYLVKETPEGIYLRRKKILDVTDRPQLYPAYLVYDNNAL